MSGWLGGGQSRPNQTISQTEQVAAGVKIQSSAYGLAFPIVYGRTRVTGNLTWYGDFTAVPHTTVTQSGGGGGGGGKGGGGGGDGGGVTTTESTTYSYTASFSLGISEGPITGYNAAWANKDYLPNAFVTQVNGATASKTETFTVPSDGVIRVTNQPFIASTSILATYGGVAVPATSITSDGTYTFDRAYKGTSISITYTYGQTQSSSSLFTQKLGTYPQTAWSYLTSAHPSQSLALPGVGYLGAAGYPLPNGTSLPNLSFDVTGRLPYSVGVVDDANPSDIVTDFITNANYGAAASFPLGNFTQFSNYCIASGLFLSPAFSEQKQANQTLDNLFKLINCGAYFSEGVLKVVPYGAEALTLFSVTYTPNITPLYDLADDDFQPAKDVDPVRVQRGNPADAFNSVTVEFLNRANQYNIEPAEAKDQVHIDTYGLRPMPVIKAHEIADVNVARLAAQIILQRSLYVRNTYEFEGSWKFVGVEPTDYLTLTDSVLGLSLTPVRVLTTEEAEDGLITFTAEDAPTGVLNTSLFLSQAGGGFAVNLNTTAGDTKTPVVFEAPVYLTATGYELWVAACGEVINPISGKVVDMPWGGCQVWASQDNQTYQMLGIITNPARMGTLTANFPVGLDPDTVNTLAVNLSTSGGSLASGTQANADNADTLCYVDGEFVSFSDVTLTAANQYDLTTYLRRGQYRTSIAAHLAGTNFVRVDDALFKFPYTPDRIGSTIYLKFPSFNVFGGGAQSLADVPAFSHYISEAILLTPLDPVTNLTVNYSSGVGQIVWTAVNDFRVIDYEVRFGTSADSSTVLGRVPTPNLPALGSNGTYWVATHYSTPDGINLYSAWTSLVLSNATTGAILTKNIIADYEQSPGWAGTCTGNAVKVGSTVILAGSGDVLTAADFLAIPDLFFYGGVGTTGTYTIPTGNRVNIGRVAPCTVGMSYTVVGTNIYNNWLTIADFLGATDLLSASAGPYVGAQPQIRIAAADAVYGNWMNYTPGQYNAQYFDGRIQLTSSDPQSYPVMSQFDFLVDVPDRVDSYVNKALASGGNLILYTTPFNGGPGGSNQPNVQITILGATANDDVVTSNSTLSGINVQIVNAGNGVARNINLFSQGY